ncbi:MAG: DNA repair protein RecN [Pseudomonadota bacterium]
MSSHWSTVMSKVRGRLGRVVQTRSEPGLVAEGAKRADISAEFVLAADHPVQVWLIEHALDGSDDEPLLIRRSLPADGGSRSWINGQPASARQLRELGGLLVEIHGQHAHQKLSLTEHQRRWIDHQIDAAVIRRVCTAAEKHGVCQAKLDDLLVRVGQRSDQELLEFQLEELNRFNPAADEYAQLEVDQRRLASVDAMKLALDQASHALNGEQAGASSLTHQAARALEPMIENEPALAEITQMISEAQVNLDEASAELQRLAENLESDPQKLNQIDQRLSRTIELARKHRVEPDQLPALHQRLSRRLSELQRFDQTRAELEVDLTEAREYWWQQAKKLHQAREKVAKALCAETAKALAQLGMKDAKIQFQIELNEQAEVATHGADRVEILFSANPGQTPKALKKVASGGELSRLSLAMIIASADPGQHITRIFDEIDAGVGGETAHRVGEFLHQTAVLGQSLCVTHLAQVAARADFQLKVEKSAKKAQTKVEIRSLDADERVAELARMLGSEASEISRKHAQSLLKGERVLA